MNGARELLRAEGLSAGYGKPEADVLSDITFSLREGERLCVIGPNGCGKTTLLRVLAGTLPYRGSLKCSVGEEARSATHGTVERRELKNREAARETGFLAQISAAYFPYTVRETVELGRYARQKPGFFPESSALDREATDQAMEAAGVTPFAEKEIGTLSGGQLQRVFFARAVAQDPAILLLDEPTNHLDLYHQLELVAKLRAWVERPGKAAVGVFHDLSLALAFADRMILMDKGQIAAVGSPGEIVRGEAINRVYGMDVAGAMRSLLQKW